MKAIFTTTDISETLTQVQDKHAELNSKIVAQMHAGVCHFFFTKKDGSVREAYGTLNKPLLESILGPQEDVQHTEPVPDSTQVMQRYYDLEARNFRQFTIANLICMF